MKISSRFSNVEYAYGSWIFVAIYGIQKLKTKTKALGKKVSPKTLKVKTCFQVKHCNYEIINWKLRFWKTD